MYRITQYDQVDRIIEETIETPYVDNYHTAKDLSRKHSKRRYQNQVKANNRKKFAHNVRGFLESDELSAHMFSKYSFSCKCSMCTASNYYGRKERSDKQRALINANLTDFEDEWEQGIYALWNDTEAKQIVDRWWKDFTVFDGDEWWYFEDEYYYDLLDNKFAVDGVTLVR